MNAITELCSKLQQQVNRKVLDRMERIIQSPESALDLEQFISGVEEIDPIKVLRGWHNYRTGLYEPGTLAGANPATDLFPDNKEYRAVYNEMVKLSDTPIRAAITILFVHNQIEREDKWRT